MSNFLEDNKVVLSFLCGSTLGAGLTYFANKGKASSTDIAPPQVYYEVSLEIKNRVLKEYSEWLNAHCLNLLKLPGFIDINLVEVEEAAKPTVIFVLGGPGAGKGTQCGKISETFGYQHISAGDCLRAERKNPNSKNGELINNYIKEGKIVPVEITVKLLKKAMQESKSNKFLIDGFPRDPANVSGWNEFVGDSANVAGVLYFDCPEKVLERRLLERGKSSGRADDNIESIRKRFNTFKTQSFPVIQMFQSMNKVKHIVADRSIDAVFAEVSEYIKQIDEEYCPKTKWILQCRCESRESLQEYFAVHAAKLRSKAFKADVKATARTLHVKKAF